MRSFKALLVGGLASAGCTPDQEFVDNSIDQVAVVAGDFDAMESLLDRLLIPFYLYDGFINGPAYSVEEDGADFEKNPLKVEGLFALDLEIFQVVFVNSGIRGFGEVIYNGVSPDDALASDPAVIEAARAYVEGGGTLVVSDWAYELVELTWPDAISFYGDDQELDDAQVGGDPASISAGVHDDLVEALGESVSIDYNFGRWTVMEGVADHVTVHLSGDTDYWVSAADGLDTLEDVPMLVSFAAGAGQVIYSNFPWNIQSAGLADALLTGLVEGLPLDTAEAGAAQQDPDALGSDE